MNDPVVHGKEVTLSESTMPATDVLAQREALIAKYQIEILGDSKVKMTLPFGTGHLDFLTEVQALVPQLYGHHAIGEKQWKEWTSGGASFYGGDMKVYQPYTFAIEGVINESIGIPTYRKDRIDRVMFPAEKDLVAAHAAYLLATGKDLFACNRVHTGGVRGGADFYFGESGLNELAPTPFDSTAYTTYLEQPEGKARVFTVGGMPDVDDHLTFEENGFVETGRSGGQVYSNLNLELGFKPHEIFDALKELKLDSSGHKTVLHPNGIEILWNVDNRYSLQQQAEEFANTALHLAHLLKIEVE